MSIPSRALEIARMNLKIVLLREAVGTGGKFTNVDEIPEGFLVTDPQERRFIVNIKEDSQ
jgi:hypothetical protein